MTQGPSWSRNWRGTHETWQAAARRYDFPVTTYRVGPNGERIPVEAADK